MANINLSNGTDTTFIVGHGSNRREINVIKVLLAMNSEYFHTLFSNKHFKHTPHDITANIDASYNLNSSSPKISTHDEKTATSILADENENGAVNASNETQKESTDDAECKSGLHQTCTVNCIDNNGTVGSGDNINIDMNDIDDISIKTMPSNNSAMLTLSPVSQASSTRYVYYEPDVSVEIFKFIVDYCYGKLASNDDHSRGGDGNNNELVINDKNLLGLLYASQKYLLNDLRKECLLFISNSTSVLNIIDIMIKLEQSPLVTYFNYHEIETQLKQGFTRIAKLDSTNANQLYFYCQQLLTCGIFIPLNTFLTYFVTNDKFTQYVKHEIIYETCVKYCQAMIEHNFETVLVPVKSDTLEQQNQPQQQQQQQQHVQQYSKDVDGVDLKMCENDNTGDREGMSEMKNCANEQKSEDKPRREADCQDINLDRNVRHNNTDEAKTDHSCNGSISGISTGGISGIDINMSSGKSPKKKHTWQQMMKDYFVQHIKFCEMNSDYIVKHFFNTAKCTSTTSTNCNINRSINTSITPSDHNHDICTLFTSSEIDVIFKSFINEQKLLAQCKQNVKSGKKVLSFSLRQSTSWSGSENTVAAITNKDDFHIGAATSKRYGSWMEFTFSPPGTGYLINKLTIASLAYQGDNLSEWGNGHQYINGAKFEYFDLAQQKYIELFKLVIPEDQKIYMFNMPLAIVTDRVRFTHNNFVCVSFVEFQGFTVEKQENQDVDVNLDHADKTAENQQHGGANQETHKQSDTSGGGNGNHNEER